MQMECLLCKGFLPETERIISFVVCAFEELDRITMLPLLNVRMRQMSHPDASAFSSGAR